MNKHHYAAILAGGIGSRFWPKSRAKFPKQFIDILNTGKTLIQTTYERYAAFIPKENIYIITATEYVDIVKLQLPHVNPANILAEPSRKNTAPCVAYMAFKLIQLDPDATMIVAPSDHYVTDDEEFQRVSLQAMGFVEHMKSFLTLGIKPTHPNTGYGYIQHEAIAVADNVFKVKTFTEKPNNELAKAFIASGDFLWNAGIFVWPVKQILKAFEHYQPEMYELFAAETTCFNTPEEKQALERIYPLCTNISIDYAIMEHANNVYVIPASFGWSDLGTWNSAYENLEKDYLGNAVAGDKVLVIDATKCMVSVRSNKLLVLQGLDDCIVVDTDDVLLICKKEKEQQIKEYVAEVRRNIGDQFL
jgi:mannose-1-phosphate guanylyltransferase